MTTDKGGKNKPYETVVGQIALKCDHFGRKATMAYCEEMFWPSPRQSCQMLRPSGLALAWKYPQQHWTYGFLQLPQLRLLPSSAWRKYEAQNQVEPNCFSYSPNWDSSLTAFCNGWYCKRKVKENKQDKNNSNLELANTENIQEINMCNSHAKCTGFQLRTRI